MSERDPADPGPDQPEEQNGPSSSDTTSGSDGSESRRTLVSGILSIAGLSSLAFAQPVYDLLRQAPEFFAIRNLYMGDVLALVVVLAIVPALVLSAPGAALRFLLPSWTRSAIAVPTGLLGGVIALQAVRGLPAPAAVTIALAAGVVIAWAYIRFRGVRAFALLLGAARRPRAGAARTGRPGATKRGQPQPGEPGRSRRYRRARTGRAGHLR